MKLTRKNFLRILGGSVVAAGTGKLVKAVSDVAPSSETTKGTKKKNVPRWGMVVDFTKCTKGCTDCINACDLAHNIPHIPDPKQVIKWIWHEPYDKIFPSHDNFDPKDIAGATLLVLCNHCTDPPCTRVCPTQATWKRYDGIVMMDYHRCIGCRYCMAACPYGSRSFNWVDPRPYITHFNPDFPTRTKGVVEKCNFCQERLSEGLQPACVEACSHKALIFGDLNDENSAVRQILRTRFSVQRRAELGTGPSVFYLV